MARGATQQREARLNSATRDYKLARLATKWSDSQNMARLVKKMAQLVKKWCDSWENGNRNFSRLCFGFPLPSVFLRIYVVHPVHLKLLLHCCVIQMSE